MKILFTYDYKKKSFDRLRDLGYEVDFWPEKYMANYVGKETIDILVCYNPFPFIDLKDFKQLKNIFLSSVGFDQLPLEDVKNMNLEVCNNKGGYSIPMGEWIVMKLLELTKHSKEMYNNQAMKNWHTDTNIEEVYQKRILFFGTGTIAKEAVKRLQGFDMTLVGLNTTGTEKPYFNECHPMKDSLLEVEKADAVVIALPLTKATRGYFDERHIAGMKSTAVFINVARGEIVNEAALIEALKNNKIKGAALDVFVDEPLEKDHPMWDLENVIVTCHNSWVSENRNSRRFETIYENLKRKLTKEPLMNVLDLNRGY